MESQVDVSRLDLRVGRILSARVHPLAEAMIVQEVDMGENSSRTVVSKVGQEAKPEEVMRLYTENYHQLCYCFK